MNIYLNLGFDPSSAESIGESLLEQVAAFGFSGIRQDVPDHHDSAWRLFRELEGGASLRPLLLIAGGRMTRNHPHPEGPPWSSEALVQHVDDTCRKLGELGYFREGAGFAIEIGNEPDIAHDLWKNNPRRLAETFSACYEVVRRYSDDCPVLTPSVSNLNSRGFKYLDAMMKAGIPDGAVVAAHRYPPGLDPEAAHRDFGSRDEEVKRLLDLAGERAVWITETGRTEGPEEISRGLLDREKEKFWLTENEITDYAAKELQFWAQFPRVEVVVWYQLNSGPDRNDPLHNYGIRRPDGTFKEVANRLPSIIASLSKKPEGGTVGENDSTCTPVMSRPQAEEVVQIAYLEILRRDPFHPLDGGAYDYVFAMMHGMGEDEVRAKLMESMEARERAEEFVRGLYLEILGRDPGPEREGGEWVDSSGLDYARDYQFLHKQAEEIREQLRASDEFKEKRTGERNELVVVDAASLREPSRDKNELPLGISLFYGLSLGVERDRYRTVIDDLSASGIRHCRLNMSTFTWGNQQGEPEVIPWKPGNVHQGYSNEVSKEFLDEMEWRLEYAVSRGVRPQLTLLWGGFRPLFVADRGTRRLREGALEKYLRAVCKRLRNHEAVTVEIMNEIDHGHHLGFLGLQGRKEFLKKWVSFCKEIIPDALFSVSDGGHQPSGGKEGDPYFDYHDVAEIDHWNVHFPRDVVSVGGVPRWCRGLWHLNGEWSFWQKRHGDKGGYGRNDENMYLQTERDHVEWPYRNSTRDWRMYGLQIFVAACAKAATTIHNQSGFFCRPGLGSEPIMKVAKTYNEVMRGFAFQGMASLNTGWRDSPIKKFETAFKAFALVGGQNRRDMLFTVLNPDRGNLTLDLRRPYQAKALEITGEVRKEATLGPGEVTFSLPRAHWPHGLIIRLAATD